MLQHCHHPAFSAGCGRQAGRLWPGCSLARRGPAGHSHGHGHGWQRLRGDVTAVTSPSSAGRGDVPSLGHRLSRGVLIRESASHIRDSFGSLPYDVGKLLDKPYWLGGGRWRLGDWGAARRSGGNKMSVRRRALVGPRAQIQRYRIQLAYMIRSFVWATGPLATPVPPPALPPAMLAAQPFAKRPAPAPLPIGELRPAARLQP